MERIATVSARLALSSMLLVASSSCAGPEDGPVVEETSAAVSSAAYGGGAVLSNVHVVPVMWTLYVNPAEIVLFRGFYKHVVASRYFDWLTEYRTPAQDIGRGSAVDVIYAFPAATDSLLDRPAIEAELALEIDGDHLPRPEANTLYMVHLPPGVAFQYGSQRSCNAGGTLEGFHASFYHNGSIRYAVIPDNTVPALGNECLCADNNLAFLTTIASRELVDAVVNPDGDGWGDIGDRCAGTAGARLHTTELPDISYVVQRQWSNAVGGCIAQKTYDRTDLLWRYSGSAVHGQLAIWYNGGTAPSPAYPGRVR